MRDGDKLLFLTQGTGNEELDKTIAVAGYSYDPVQDIFFSTMDPWQRNVGYCRLYDEAAAPLGMIIDCEPIYFEYQGKKWMIGLWKGQYDLVTGGEIGVYEGVLDLAISGVFSGTFYNAVRNDDRLQMSYTLNKNGNTLFTREGKHWWLTGFKLGEFSEPSELQMDTVITFENVLMRDAFVSGLRNAGYSDPSFKVVGNTVSFRFDVPHTTQPLTRTEKIDWIIQRKNKLLCEKYQEITEPYDTFPEKVKAIEELAPEMYEQILTMGKNKKHYEMFIMIIMIGASLLSYVTKSKDRDKKSIDSM